MFIRSLALSVAAATIGLAWPSQAQDAACVAKAQKLFRNQLPPLTACSHVVTAGSTGGSSGGNKTFHEFRIAGAGFSGVVQISTDRWYNAVAARRWADYACGCSVGGAETEGHSSGMQRFAQPGQAAVFVGIDQRTPGKPLWKFGMTGDEAAIVRLWSAMLKEQRDWTAVLQ